METGAAVAGGVLLVGLRLNVHLQLEHAFLERRVRWEAIQLCSHSREMAAEQNAVSAHSHIGELSSVSAEE